MGIKRALIKKEIVEIGMDRAFLFSILVQFLLISMLLFIYTSYSHILTTDVPVTITITSNETELIKELEGSGVNVIITGSTDTKQTSRPSPINTAAATIDIDSKEVKSDPSNIMSSFAIAKIKSVSEKISFAQALEENNFDFRVERNFEGSAEFIQMGYGILIPICIILPAIVAMSLSTQSIFTERKRNTIELLLVSPISNNSIAVYKVFPLVLISVLCSAAWLTMVSLQIPTSNIPLLLFVSLSLSLLLVSLSVVFSCKSKTVREANAMSSVAGMFAMVSLVLPYSPLVIYSPTSVMARAASNTADADMLIGAGILAVFSVLSYLVALRAVTELRRSYT
ncbi:MAG: ABC transporter permease [Candidatus Micrarchaeota archaeon]